MDLIKDGDYVVIQRNERSFLKRLNFPANEEPVVQVSKDRVNFKPVFSQCFDSVFKMIPPPDKKVRKGGNVWNLVKVEDEDEVSGDPDVVVDDVITADNRDLEDKDDAQTLKIDDVEAMKAAMLDSKEIIGKLIENSATFDEKTKFSQVIIQSRFIF